MSLSSIAEYKLVVYKYVYILGFIIVGGEKHEETQAVPTSEVFNPKTRKSCRVGDLPAGRKAELHQSIIIRMVHSHWSRPVGSLDARACS